MQKLNPTLLVLIIVIAVGVDLNLVLPFLGVGVDVIPDTIPLLGNLDEAILILHSCLAAKISVLGVPKTLRSRLIDTYSPIRIFRRFTTPRFQTILRRIQSIWHQTPLSDRTPHTFFPSHFSHRLLALSLCSRIDDTFDHSTAQKM